MSWWEMVPRQRARVKARLTRSVSLVPALEAPALPIVYSLKIVAFDTLLCCSVVLEGEGCSYTSYFVAQRKSLINKINLFSFLYVNQCKVIFNQHST